MAKPIAKFKKKEKEKPLYKWLGPHSKGYPVRVRPRLKEEEPLPPLSKIYLVHIVFLFCNINVLHFEEKPCNDMSNIRKGIVVGRITSPQKINMCLSPGTCEYVTLYGKRRFQVEIN